MSHSAILAKAMIELSKTKCKALPDNLGDSFGTDNFIARG